MSDAIENMISAVEHGANKRGGGVMITKVELEDGYKVVVENDAEKKETRMGVESRAIASVVLNDSAASCDDKRTQTPLP